MLPQPFAPALATERLGLRPFELEDAAFVLELVNEPPFLRFIGDKGVRDLESARAYLRDGPMASYARNGFGLYLVSLSESGEPLGMCGLIDRESLEDVDLGFAFREAHWGQGYALEAARAVLEDGRKRLGIERVVAVTDPDNTRSGRLLERLGLRFEGLIHPGGATLPSRLYVPVED